MGGITLESSPKVSLPTEKFLNGEPVARAMADSTKAVDSPPNDDTKAVESDPIRFLFPARMLLPKKMIFFRSGNVSAYVSSY